jgi:hypothetical protein
MPCLKWHPHSFALLKMEASIFYLYHLHCPVIAWWLETDIRSDTPSVKAVLEVR